MDQKLRRVLDVTDPKRCQAITNGGEQCMYEVSEEALKFCPLHTPRNQVAQNNLKNLRLTNWKARVETLGNSENIKSLSDEIGILRMILEEKLEGLSNSHMLIANEEKIRRIITDISVVVEKADKLDRITNSMLSKAQVMQFLSIIVATLNENVTDKNILKKIIFELEQAFQRIVTAEPV